eukprot:14914082-Ditylum_brightwellii.AAC.1
MSHIIKLYLQLGIDRINPNITHKAKDKQDHYYNCPDAVILNIFEQMKTCKTTDPFADITDTLRDLAIKRCSLTLTTSNVQLTWQYLRLLKCNIIPHTIQ